MLLMTIGWRKPADGRRVIRGKRSHGDAGSIKLLSTVFLLSPLLKLVASHRLGRKCSEEFFRKEPPVCT